jgi:hypothetical protein
MTRRAWFGVLVPDLVLALVLGVGAPGARAQAPSPAPASPPALVSPDGGMVERNVKAMPGVDTRVGIYSSIKPDCTSGPLPAIRLAASPAHGAVTVKRGMLKATNFRQCLATDVPVFIAFYRAADGFSGADEFALEISFSGGRKQYQHFRVSVSNTPKGGQGI